MWLTALAKLTNFLNMEATLFLRHIRMNMHESVRFISTGISILCVFSFLVSSTAESELSFDSLFQSDGQHGLLVFRLCKLYYLKKRNKRLANKLKHHKAK